MACHSFKPVTRFLLLGTAEPLRFHGFLKYGTGEWILNLFYKHEILFLYVLQQETIILQQISIMPIIPAGFQWLKEHYNLSRHQLTHTSYIGNHASIEFTSKGNIEQVYGHRYIPANNTSLDQLEKYIPVQLVFSKSSATCSFKFLEVSYQLTIAHPGKVHNRLPAGRTIAPILLRDHIVPTLVTGRGYLQVQVFGHAFCY
jgi:hypothetical protein